MADDVTSKIERLEVFEERLGVTLESLSAFLQGDGGEGFLLIVRGELQPRNGAELREDVELMIATYDSSGRIIGTNSRTYYAQTFFGLETFDLGVYLPLSQVSKIRVYPKKG